jgi:hypothetical protein
MALSASAAHRIYTVVSWERAELRALSFYSESKAIKAMHEMFGARWAAVFTGYDVAPFAALPRKPSHIYVFIDTSTNMEARYYLSREQAEEELVQLFGAEHLAAERARVAAAMAAPDYSGPLSNIAGFAVFQATLMD